MDRKFEDLDAEVRALGYETEYLGQNTTGHAWAVRIAGLPFKVYWAAEHRAWMCASDARSSRQMRVLRDLRAAVWAAVVEERSDSGDRVALAQAQHERLGVQLARLDRGAVSWESEGVWSARPD